MSNCYVVGTFDCCREMWYSRGGGVPTHPSNQLIIINACFPGALAQDSTAVVKSLWDHLTTKLAASGGQLEFPDHLLEPELPGGQVFTGGPF
jgi:hypothetical protein